MKVRSLSLIFIFACALLFAFLTVRFTNHNLERTFQESSRSSFYLLSFIVDHLFQHEKIVETNVIQNLRNRLANTSFEPAQLLYLQNDRDIQGIWIIERNRVTGATEYANEEYDIVKFYNNNLKGKNANTLIFLHDKPFFLVNTNRDKKDVLLLYDASAIYEVTIERILDSLITSSNLRYFAILDKENTPVLFSTLYENFLPLKGRGYHKIETPEGSIFQIEEFVTDNRIVAGFDMQSLSRIKRTNNIFLLVTVLIFIVLEGVLLIRYVKAERFKLVKEREISRLKEVGALSTGFAHEFRNSLHTLSLLADEMEKENKTILLDETTRMRSIMDSLRLLGTREIKKEEIEVSELIKESIALLNHAIKTNDVTIRTDVEPKLVGHGNRSLLVTAVSNIIKNSIEAGAKNIGITAGRKGRELHIVCKDDGKGIESSISNDIFTPFFSKKGQSGIGLYLTKRIIELHGGKITAQSNGYTLFKIVLVT
ncbi:MAG: HAMP domain-containing histidine kinase [candidate division WOR-3 bacterium]|nr:MAG: HAMP domain-containing histidine kinase [candidate division WOR-3 bacterium]